MKSLTIFAMIGIVMSLLVTGTFGQQKTIKSKKGIYKISATEKTQSQFQASITKDYKVAKSGVATPKNKKVLLLKEPTGKNDIILFQTNLRVNTDGSPLSYHPQDPRGKDKALNNVCNAIAVRKENSVENLCLTKFSEAIGVFEQWRDTNYRTVPQGYSITWNNVLPVATEGGKSVPCVFKTGDYKGYFGSLTALKNDLVGDKSECEIENQVNPMTVPALVLLGGKNVIKEHGAKVGDLVVAYNPKTNIVVSAVIGDTGPKDNLGEGSIYLNMKLLGATTPPKNKADTFKLSIEKPEILVAIIPSSRLFEIDGNKPYTVGNINQRVKNWQKKAGFSTPESFLKLMKSFQTQLN